MAYETFCASSTRNFEFFDTYVTVISVQKRLRSQRNTNICAQIKTTFIYYYRLLNYILLVKLYKKINNKNLRMQLKTIARKMCI